MAVTKEEILREIHRTAKESGGVPLGRARFRTETGIRVSDWGGKLWARWGDALREAGFAANELQGAYDEVKLLEAYIGLTRELGHVPVHNELMMKRRSDPAFPSHNTFAKFGGRSALIDRALQYCRSCSGYDDIISLCELDLAVTTRKPSTPKESITNGEIGYVYLIKSGRFYKIGRSNAAGRREYELAIQLPEKAATVHLIKTDDPVGIEAYWHRRFADKRGNGEWFNLAAADVSAFKRRRFM